MNFTNLINKGVDNVFKLTDSLLTEVTFVKKLEATFNFNTDEVSFASEIIVYRPLLDIKSYDEDTSVATIIVIDSLISNHNYVVKVKGHFDGVKSVLGETLISDHLISFTTGSSSSIDIETPATISNLVLSVLGSSRIKLDWSSSISAKYWIERSLDNISFSQISCSNTNFFIDDGLISNTRYYYRVRSHTVKGTPGEYSSIALATTSKTFYTMGFDNLTPAVLDVTSTESVNLGMRFKATIDGYITGIRFFAVLNDASLFKGSIWTNQGDLLGECILNFEDIDLNSNWQTIQFANPIHITANREYFVSYYSPSGRFAYTGSYFTQNIVSEYLIALKDETNNHNGYMSYASFSRFPTVYTGSNYFVDVIFVDSILVPLVQPLAIISTVPDNNTLDVNTEADLKIFFNKALNPATVDNYTIQLLDYATSDPIDSIILKAFVVKSTKASEDRDVFTKQLILKTKDIGNLSLYDSVYFDNFTWKLGPPILSDFLTTIEVFREV